MNILITGTSSGLGYGLAMHYLSQGHKVYGVSRKANKDLAQYPKFTFLSQDITDYKSLKDQLPAFLGQVSSLDLVILNAGILKAIKDMKDTSLKEIHEVMDINVWSNKVFLDLLFDTVDRVKQVVAISSGAAVNGTRGWNAYSLSKATLNMLMDLYAQERSQTHFCALAPGLVETAMQDYLNNLPQSFDEKFPMVPMLKKARGTTNMPKPQEAAKIVANAIQTATNHESGTFLDVRGM